MCGLIATTDWSLFQQAGWDGALAALAPRGPDAEGRLSRGDYSFGHRRLAVIGLGAGGAQPVAQGPSQVLVFNGEIYNYRELAREMGVVAESDTKVLGEIGTRGWSGWIDRLRGMYSFVHFNTRDGTISTARDPFGIKPLYVRKHSNGALSFSSVVSALLTSRDRSGPDLSALAGFLARGAFSSGTSPFEGITKLPAGELWQWQRVGDGSWTHRAFRINLSGWPTRSIPESLADSVAAHLVSDVEVGVLLSGGVDSTLLTALATTRVGRVRTFSLTNPDDPSIDEADFARRNASLLGTEHREIPVSPNTLAARAAPIIASSGEPFGDPAYLPLSALSEAVSTCVKVALAGEGADELFCGYRRYDIERLLDSPYVGRLLLRGSEFVPAHILGKSRQLSRVLTASRAGGPYARHQALLDSTWGAVLRAFPEVADPAAANDLIRWAECARDPWALEAPANRAYDTREWLPNVYLEKSDRASMLHGLELRTPYLDPIVASAVRGWQPRNTAKHPLRSELKRLVPGVELPRRKRGLAVNTGALIADHFGGIVRRTVLDRSSVLTGMGLRDPERLLADARVSVGLSFRLAMLGLWQEAFL